MALDNLQMHFNLFCGTCYAPYRVYAHKSPVKVVLDRRNISKCSTSDLYVPRSSKVTWYYTKGWMNQQQFEEDADMSTLLLYCSV